MPTAEPDTELTTEEFDEVVKLHPISNPDPDDMLEAAKGVGFESLSIIGQLEDGQIWISSNMTAGAFVILMEKVKRLVIFDE